MLSNIKMVFQYRKMTSYSHLNVNGGQELVVIIFFSCSKCQNKIGICHKKVNIQYNKSLIRL